MTAVPSQRFGDRAFIAIGDEDDIVRHLVRPHLSDRGEWVLLLSFAGDGRLLAACENGGRRTSDAALTPMMVRMAVAPGAGSRVLLAHNHPSGELRPSADDILVTRQFALLCRMAGIGFADHLILGLAGHFSCRAAGLI
jgi:DNA repair protein RadC